MALGEFYKVPEINPETATHAVFGSRINGIYRSMDKTVWACELLEDLAGRRPEDLPPCFLAVKAQGLSCNTGWKTANGKWVQRDAFVDGPRLCGFVPMDSDGTWLRTTLVFRLDDGKKTDLAMTMYNVLHRRANRLLELEEDMALCHVFRVPKEKRKPAVRRKLSQFPDLDSLDIPDFTCDVSDVHFGIPNMDEYIEDNDLGGYDQPFVDSSGGPQKQAGSHVWNDFIQICNKHRKVLYAACHHCHRVMKLTGGSRSGTSSLKRHIDSCKCKPGTSADNLN